MATTWLAATSKPDEPNFIAKLGGRVVEDRPLRRLRFTRYAFKSDLKVVLKEMKLELVPKGWKFKGDRVSMFKPDPDLSSWSFKKGEDSYQVDPFNLNEETGETEVHLYYEMTWLEQKWHTIRRMVGG